MIRIILKRKKKNEEKQRVRYFVLKFDLDLLQDLMDGGRNIWK